MNLACIDPAQVGYFWPHVEPLLRPAIEDVGLSDFEDIARDILTGRDLVWIAANSTEIKAAAATALQRIGEHKICILVACGGHDMQDWLPLMQQIEEYAKAEGCKSMRIYGREGWLRALDGYQKKAVVIEKDL